MAALACYVGEMQLVMESASTDARGDGILRRPVVSIATLSG